MAAPGLHCSAGPSLAATREQLKEKERFEKLFEDKQKEFEDFMTEQGVEIRPRAVGARTGGE